ncbi:MAG: Nif3-like dinuclear metal center hexameric protein [Solirubrobacterales bacterium]
MADRDEIVKFCAELLETASFSDYGPNGLQVPGREEVTTVATAVSAHLESIEASVEAGADLLLTHHGLFWDFHPRSLSTAMASRLKLALSNDLSIASYHLPLDAHPEIGNNVLLCHELGFKAEAGAIGVVKGRGIGAIGRREDGIQTGELTELIQSRLGRKPLVFAEGPGVISSIGIVSGAAASNIHTAVELGLDAFLTGEPSEHVMADSREGKINFIAAGHYATETFGIRRLGEKVAEQFEINHVFLDLPNPI